MAQYRRGHSVDYPAVLAKFYQDALGQCINTVNNLKAIGLTIFDVSSMYGQQIPELRLLILLAGIWR